MNAQAQTSTAVGTGSTAQFDAIVIGAGFGGIRALYELRQLGLSVKVCEAADDVGGVWYWNCYPGARTDSEAWAYCYSFSDELQDEWIWPERMPSWDQVAAYLRHVVDKFDLRKHIQFKSYVKSAVYDETTNKWTITMASGEEVTGTYFIPATGLLTVAYEPPFKGLKTFEGQTLLTSRWPKQPVEFAGKRVGIVGSGSTAVQLLPVVAQTAAHVTLFQRTPNYVLPGRNHALDDAQRQAIRTNREAIWSTIRKQVFAFPMDPANRVFDDLSAADRKQVFDAGWEAGGFRYLFETFDDILTDERSNAEAAEFIRNKIRAIVKNPVTAELLCPKYPFALKRPPLGNFYYEAFNRANVSLVDVSRAPIEEITPRGLVTGGKEYEFDILVFALGFDAMTGALTHMDVRGKDGTSLKEKWQAGPQTQLGVTVDGFPNMFMISGPHTPFANIPPIVEGTVGWIGRAIQTVRDGGHAAMEPTPQAVAAWGRRINELLDATLLGQGAEYKSWFMGANIPGKAHAVLFYFGGAGAFFAELETSADSGFPGFTFRGKQDLGAQSRG